MHRSRMGLVGLTLCILISGCVTHQPAAESAKTTVYRDGFRAIQITKIPPDWSGKGKEVTSYCAWKQLAKFSGDGRYYCPLNPDDELRTQYGNLLVTASYMEEVIPAAGDLLSGLGTGIPIMYGLMKTPTSTVTQTGPTQTIRTSTLVMGGPAPSGVAP